METLVGAIRLRRPSLYCESGQRGSAPLETALALTGRRKPPDVQKAAVKVTKELPYATAGELFEELTGLPLSAHAAHEVTPEVVQGLSWHPVQTDEDLAAARRQVTTTDLIPEAQVRLRVIAEGARWIWQHTQKPWSYCPHPH